MKLEDFKFTGKQVAQPFQAPTEAGNEVEKEEEKQDPTPEWASKFKDPSEMWAELQKLSAKEPEVKEVVKEVKPTFKSDLLKELAEIEAGGGDPVEFLKVKNQNFDAISDKEIIKMKLQKDYPGITGEDLDILFDYHMKKEYEADEDDESSQKLASVRMKAEAAKYRASLKKEQTEQLSAAPRKPESAPAEVVAEQQEDQAAAEWSKTIDEHPVIKQYMDSKTVTLKQDGQEYKFEFDPEVLSKVAKDDTVFWSLFASGDASNPIDWSKLAKVVAYASNPEAFEKSLFSFGKGQGAKSAVEVLENPSKGGPAPAPANATLTSAIMAALNKRK